MISLCAESRLKSWLEVGFGKNKTGGFEGTQQNGGKSWRETIRIRKRGKLMSQAKKDALEAARIKKVLKFKQNCYFLLNKKIVYCVKFCCIINVDC